MSRHCPAGPIGGRTSPVNTIFLSCANMSSEKYVSLFTVCFPREEKKEEEEHEINPQPSDRSNCFSAAAAAADNHFLPILQPHPKWKEEAVIEREI